MDADEKYIDLLIDGDSIVLDHMGNPVLISGRSSIAQDLKHMIRESGLLVELVGQRSTDRVKLNLIKLENLVEDDIRIKPGTASITQTDTETFWIQATTIDYGDVEFYL